MRPAAAHSKDEKWIVYMRTANSQLRKPSSGQRSLTPETSALPRELSRHPFLSIFQARDYIKLFGLHQNFSLRKEDLLAFISF